MKIAFFNLNCILRDRLLSRKIVTVYGGLCPAVTPVWSPPLLRKGLYMNLLTECTPACSSPRAATALISIFVININYFARERRSDFECKSTSAPRRFLSRPDFLDLQLYLDFFFLPPQLRSSSYSDALREAACGGADALFAGVCSISDGVFFITQTSTKKTEVPNKCGASR